MDFNVPILFQIFNRLDTSLKVFNVIRQIKPRYLYIAQDGPRKNKFNEVKDCLIVRSKILEQVDWRCELVTEFRDENLGPGKGTADALIWFFKHVDYGIVLEHDCLPHPDFFEYCAILLEKYRNEEKVMLINGSNFQNGLVFGQGSYYFGVTAQIWGWAAWNRTFDSYEYNIGSYDQLTVFEDIKSTFKTRYEQKYWQRIYGLMKDKEIDTWDYQLLFTIWHQKGLIVLPNVNLISNIGFGDLSINCRDGTSPLANSKTYPILPLIHKSKTKRSYKADKNYMRNYLNSYPGAFMSLKMTILDYTPDFIHNIYRVVKKLIY